MKASFTRWLCLSGLLLLTAGRAAQAQTGVTIGATTAPDASAALDIISTSKGVLLPRVALATGIASPATGLIVFQTGAPAGYYYNAGTPGAPSWQQLATAAGAAVTAGNGLTKTGQTIALGGSLSTPVTIVQNGNNFSLSGGSVGIGTALPAATLETSGDFRVSNGTTPNTLGTPATGNASNTSFPFAGQSFTMPAGGGSVTSVRLRSAATYSTTFAIYQGGGNGGALLYGPAPVSFVTDVPSTVPLPTPLTLAAGLYTVTLTAPQNLRYFSSDVYAGGSFYFGGGAGPTIDMEFAVSYTTGAATSSLYVAPGGNVGIGTAGIATPGAKLDVTGGSIKISTSGQGLIFPDGTTQTTAAAPANLTGDVTSVGAATTYNNVVPAAKGGAGAVSGLLKANGAGTVSQAVAGTDYLAPTGSAAALTSFPTLNQNTTGNAATATLANTVVTNANLTGAVTSVGNATTYAAVVPAAKGGAGTVSGLLKADGAGVVSAAAAGTDYAAATGSADYIQNQTSADQAGSFRLSGSGSVGTLKVAGALTGTGGSISGVGVGIRADGGLNLGQNTTGNSIYLGSGAGGGITGGSGRNTFLGFEAGLNAGTATNNSLYLGFRAGYNGGGGSANIYLGGFSGYRNGGGSGNVFVGYNGGYHNTSGSNNTALGDNSGPADGSGTITNATALGANVTLVQSNSVVLGNGAKVGIGTNAPAKRLHVDAGNDFLRLDNLAQVSNTNSYLVIDNAGNVGKTTVENVAGQVIRLGFNAGNYFENTTDPALAETALRFDAHSTALLMGNAPNGAPNFINTITGSSVATGQAVAANAANGTRARTTDQITLPAGVYRVTVRLSGNYFVNSANGTVRSGFVKFIVNNNEYSLVETLTAYDNGITTHAEVSDYLNLSGAASTVDFSVRFLRNFALTDRLSPGTGNSYRSLLLIERVR